MGFTSGFAYVSLRNDILVIKYTSMKKKINYSGIKMLTWSSSSIALNLQRETNVSTVIR